jgi:hypothetical protein
LPGPRFAAALTVAIAVMLVTLLPGMRLLVTAVAPGGELDLSGFLSID